MKNPDENTDILSSDRSDEEFLLRRIREIYDDFVGTVTRTRGDTKEAIRQLACLISDCTTLLKNYGQEATKSTIAKINKAKTLIEVSKDVLEKELALYSYLSIKGVGMMEILASSKFAEYRASQKNLIQIADQHKNLRGAAKILDALALIIAVPATALMVAGGIVLLCTGVGAGVGIALLGGGAAGALVAGTLFTLARVLNAPENLYNFIAPFNHNIYFEREAHDKATQFLFFAAGGPPEVTYPFKDLVRIAVGLVRWCSLGNSTLNYACNVLAALVNKIEANFPKNQCDNKQINSSCSSS